MLFLVWPPFRLTMIKMSILTGASVGVLLYAYICAEYRALIVLKLIWAIWPFQVTAKTNCNLQQSVGGHQLKFNEIVGVGVNTTLLWCSDVRRELAMRTHYLK